VNLAVDAEEIVLALSVFEDRENVGVASLLFPERRDAGLAGSIVVVPPVLNRENETVRIDIAGLADYLAVAFNGLHAGVIAGPELRGLGGGIGGPPREVGDREPPAGFEKTPPRAEPSGKPGDIDRALGPDEIERLGGELHVEHRGVDGGDLRQDSRVASVLGEFVEESLADIDCDDLTPG